MANKLISSLLVLALYCSFKMADAQAQPWNGALWAQKVTLFFNQNDMNKNGLQDPTDINDIASAYSDVFASNPLEEALIKAQVEATLTGIWTKLYLNLPIAAPPGSQRTAATLMASVSQLGYLDAVASVAGAAPLYFLLWDDDSTKSVTLEEYQSYFSIFGLSPAIITASFNTLDTNGDGVVSLPENIAGWEGYFTTSDPSNKYNGLLGPLSPSGSG